MQIILTNKECLTIYGALVTEKELVEEDIKKGVGQDNEVFKKAKIDLEKLIERFVNYV